MACKLENMADAVILDLTGPVKKQHVPLRCQSRKCDEKGTYQWHNYYVAEGKHVFNGRIADMQCFMVTSRFGVSIPFLEQLHLRMLREHVSFAGEADVALRFAKRKGYVP